MPKVRLWILAAVTSGVMGAAMATTLVPMTLDEQIDEAEQIFRGRVAKMQAVEEAVGGGRRIVTRVQFAPVAIYKGDVPSPIELTFLGGRVGDTEMRVDGMPQFEVGGEYVIFVSADKQRACPVVGWTQGTLPVDPATGVVQLSKPVAEGLRGSHTAAAAAAAAGELQVTEFEAALRERIREAGKP